MVVPDSTGVIQPQADNGSGTGGLMESSPPGYEEEREQELAGVELEEVRKLQELVRRLEVQNQTLRNRGAKNILHGGASNNSNLTGGTNMNQRLSSCEGVTGSAVGLEYSGRDLELSPPQDSSSGEDMSPLPRAERLEQDGEEEGEDGGSGAGFLTLPCGNGGPGPGHGGQTPDSPSLDSYESETLLESDSGVDQSALDEVEVLDLDDEGPEMEEEDSWLYVSPKKQVFAPGPESPLKWCRKVLDHPSPETEVACRTLLNRLDQTSRWRSMYSSPSGSVEACSSSALLSPGYQKSTNKPLLTCGSPGYMRSALSSQSSIDSELSTSDDSISMGYKLQDLTDVQIMARLQEESLRQDYASSSASVSRRSSSASLQSLRRGGGAYSDQELDALSLEDEEEEGGVLPQRRPRYSPSPLGSPRCLSPAPVQGQGGGGYQRGRLVVPRARAPRHSLQGPSAELLKFARSEEELRHSMPNLAPRTSLRTLEAVRNSRSVEANLQSSSNRMTRPAPPKPSSGVTPGRLRAGGQSPLSLRAPVKAMGPVGSVTGARQASRALPVVQGAGPAGGVRRVQSPGGGGAYPAAARGSAGAGRPGGASTPARGRLTQPHRRSLGMSSRGPMSDESWKEGCY